MSNRLRKPLEEELALARARNKKRHALQAEMDRGMPVHVNERGQLRYAMDKFWLRGAEINTFRVFGTVEVRRPFWPLSKRRVRTLGYCPRAEVGRWYAITEQVRWAGDSVVNAVYMYSNDPLWASSTYLPLLRAQHAPLQSARFHGAVIACEPVWSKSAWFIVLKKGGAPGGGLL